VERINIHIERLPEGVYLATSRDVPGLTVEADSREEAQRIALKVAIELIREERPEAETERPEFAFTHE
jgi:predicted RNase H-like HicB family nuclease